MTGRADERAVSVQVGAVLLLAILVSALGLYQLNVVPNQNYVVEADHNERVQGELQDVRNAIVNTAGDRADRSASVRLGTQYDARAVAINPPNPTGTIRTVEPATPITVENAEIDDDRIADLLDDDVETRFIEYRPRYNEYRNAPRTQFEHTLLYNEFGEGNVTIADQRLLREGALDLVVVDGDLSRTGGGTVSVDVRTLGGPGETTIRPDGGTPELTIPTDAPARWEAAIGTEFDEGESDARVASVDDGSVTIELDEAFDLRVAKVEVGSGGESDDRYDGEPEDVEVGEPRAEGAFSGTFQGGNPEEATVRGDGLYRFVEIDDDGHYRIGGVPAGSYGDVVAETDDGLVYTSDDFTVEEDETTEGVDFELEQPAEPFFEVEIVGTNSPVDAGETLEVTADIENLGEASGTQDITLDIEPDTGQGSEPDNPVDVETLSLDDGENAEITLEWETDEDAGGPGGSTAPYTATVSSDDASGDTTVEVE